MIWAYLTGYALIAIFISVCAAVAIFMVAFNKRLPVDAVLLYIAATAGSISYGFSGRDLGALAETLQNPTETIAGRIANLLCLGLCAVAIIQVAMKGVVSRFAVAVAVATAQFYFICFIFPATFDRWYDFNHKYLYPLASLAILIAPYRLPISKLAVNFARAATIPPFVSLALIFINYKAAVYEKYNSLIPFFTGRLYGATPHPNVLGMICSLAIVLLVSFPPARKREAIALLSINVLALLLCQSKTSWIATLFALSLILLPRVKSFSGRIPAWIYIAAMLAFCAVPLVLSVSSHSSYSFWSGNENIARITTLSGRTDIWQATLFLVRSHLLLGPGWATYVMYMQSLYPSLIADPHNLYLAVFVQAGLVGMISFIIYLGTLIITSANLQGRERLFGLACVGLIIIRGMSESFSFQLAFVAPTFWTLLIFMRLIGVAAAEARDRKLAQPQA